MELRRVPLSNNDKSLSIRAAAVIWLNDKYLLVQNEGQTKYKHPGGHINHDESLAVGLQRELTEEIGLDIKVTSTPYSFDMLESPERFMITAYFRLTVTTQEIDSVLTNQILPARLLSLQELSKEITYTSEIRAIKELQALQ